MTQDRQAWEAAAGRLARRVNLGWWLQQWMPWTLGLALLGAAAVLVLRSLGWTDLQMAWWGLCAGCLAAAMGALLWARGRAETVAAARVRLEESLGLHARLSAAADGVGSWPSFPAEGVALPVTWKWSRPALTLLGAAGLLALAALVPIPAKALAKPRIIEKPSAVREVEAWVEQLRQEDAVEPKALEEVERKVEELLKRPSDEWYQHASLEAAENLRDEVGRDLQELGTALEQTRGSLTTLSELGEKLSEASQTGLSKQLQDNLQGLKSGGMVASDDLMKQLQGIDPTSFTAMSESQKQALKDKLKDNANALRDALKNSPKFEFKE
jgi:hypothetical protein